MRNLTQISVFHGFPFVKMKMRRYAPVRMGWPVDLSQLALSNLESGNGAERHERISSRAKKFITDCAKVLACRFPF
jgi:hypothetical protein